MKIFKYLLNWVSIEPILLRLSNFSFSLTLVSYELKIKINIKSTVFRRFYFFHKGLPSILFVQNPPFCSVSWDLGTLLSVPYLRDLGTLSWRIFLTSQLKKWSPLKYWRASFFFLYFYGTIVHFIIHALFMCYSSAIK